jgi:hypothetical protein
MENESRGKSAGSGVLIPALYVVGVIVALALIKMLIS